MSGALSRKVSASSTQSRGHSPAAVSELQPQRHSNSYAINVNVPGPPQPLNNEWPSWDSDNDASPKVKNITGQANNITAVGSMVSFPTVPRGQPNEDGWTTIQSHSQQDDHGQYHSLQQQSSPSGGPPPPPPARPVNSALVLGPPHWFHPSANPDMYQNAADVRYMVDNSTKLMTTIHNHSQAFAHPQPGNYESLPIPLTNPDDIPGGPRGLTLADDTAIHRGRNINPHFQPRLPPPSLIPQLHTSYNAFAPPDYRSFYMMPAPERFGDFPFRYEGFPLGIPGQPPYPIPHATHLNHSPPNGHYPQLPPLMAQSLATPPIPPGGRPQHPGFYEFGPPGHATPFFYPSPPHIMLSSPMPTQPTPAQQAVSTTPTRTSYNRPNDVLTQGTIGRRASNRITSAPKALPQHNNRPSRTRRHLLPDFQPANRSPLLEEFRSNAGKRWELKNIFGHIVEFSGDQYGSRFIQLRLEEASDEEKQMVFDEIVPAQTDNLMQDVFGNYVIQKLFEFGTAEHQEILGDAVEQRVVALALHIYGCRVVQKAIEHVSRNQQTAIIRELQAHILQCIKDAHGNHVIQKLIETVSPEQLLFLPTICENINDLSTHPYGCRVLQRCLEHLSEEYNGTLLAAIHHHTVDFVQDQYGNYVIQFIIEHGRPQDKDMVISKICDNLVQLSRQKFASNVCERALKHADRGTRRRLIDQLLKTNDDQNPLPLMIRDQYANYVLQCALGLSEDDQRDALLTQVKPIVAELRRATTSYNKPLLAIEKLIERCGHGACYPLNSDRASIEDHQIRY